MGKVIVTGGAGFIGGHVVDRLIDNDLDVVIIDDLSTGSRKNVNKKAKFIKGSVNRINSGSIWKNTDIVFHLAARPRISFAEKHAGLAHYSNVTGTLHVLEMALKWGVEKVVYSSSSSVYGVYDKPISELIATPNPVSIYGFQKYVGELYGRLYKERGLGFTALRYFNVYGKRMKSGGYGTVIANFLESKKKGKPFLIHGSGTQKRDFTHVSDVVQANMLAAASANNGIYNIGCGNPVSIYNLAKIIDPDREIICNKNASSGVAYSCANNNWAKESLGWSPVIDIKTGIKELL
jgi:UDP-glucose 4-epimerase